MKKCAPPYPGDDSAHKRLATLDRKPVDANLLLQGTLLRMRHTGECRAAPPFGGRESAFERQQ
ncbi:hypothetical protein OKW29_006546 [Paraburkholderia sp. CI3]